MVKALSFFFLCTATLACAQITVDSLVSQQTSKILQDEFAKSTDYPIFEIIGDETPVLNISAAHEKTESFHRFYFELNDRNSAIQNEQDVRTIAAQDIKRIFPKKIADSLMMARIGLEYESRNGKIRIVGALAMLHRLIDGFPERGESYVFMYYDSSSNLKNIEIKWNTYKKDFITDNQSRQQNLELQSNELNKKISELGKPLTKDNIQGNLYKAIKSWRLKKDIHGIKYLVPSITYLGTYAEDGRNRYFSFDIDIHNTETSNLSHTDICYSNGEQK